MNNTIIQWNINGLYQKLPELKLILHKYQPKVICIQETDLAPHQTANISLYKQFRMDYTEAIPLQIQTGLNS